MYDRVMRFNVPEIANKNNNRSLFPDNYTFMHPFKKEMMVSEGHSCERDRVHEPIQGSGAVPVVSSPPIGFKRHLLCINTSHVDILERANLT